MIESHTAPTLNGQQAILILEKIGGDHMLLPVNFGNGRQRFEEHTRLSLKQKVLAIVDTDWPDDY